MQKILLIFSLMFLLSTTSVAQEPLLPPIAESLELGFQSFPYVKKLRRVCKKNSGESFCPRVEQFDAAVALQDDYCSSEGLELAQCAEWKLEQDCQRLGWWSRWRKSCRVQKKKRAIEIKEFKKLCYKDPQRAYCEGVAYRLAKKKKKR